ncbi:MAG: 30S ribosomal protein S4 [Mycoplasmataceae bacterium]|jgi:small subunit ribosomal protein S4|nr:30S ribosomal protein S4 [Mycoplasmataceae bacterium]
MRYTGSINKKSRRLGFSILENNKEFSKGKKRTTPPGQHGARKSRTSSEYKIQLVEKQKAALMYGVTDTQFKLTVIRAKKIEGSNTLNLLQLLESRLDNLVYRLGFSPTRRGARQLVTHGHIVVNGKKQSIPSMNIKPGAVIEVKDKYKNSPLAAGVDKAAFVPAPFVETDLDKKVGKYLRLPELNELNPDLKPSLIIEYYNRLL